MFEEMKGSRFKCLCADNKLRIAVATGEADTWFSIPARMQAFGKTVTGYVTGGELDCGIPCHEFRVYRYRKNYNVIKNVLARFRLPGEGTEPISTAK